MKTTVEVPDELMRRLKLQAAHEGRKLKDIIVEALRSRLGEEPLAAGDALVRNPISGHLMLAASGSAPKKPVDIEAILQEQDAEWYGRPS